MLELNYILGSVQSFVSLPSVEYDTSFRASFYLPLGKADDTPSPALARVRSSLLQVEVPCSKLQRSFHCKELIPFPDSLATPTAVGNALAVAVHP